MNLRKPDRERLGAMLALAESETNDQAGERLAALNAIERLLKKNGFQLRNLTIPAPVPEHQPPLMGTWRETCRRLLQRKNDLRKWEVGFVTDLPKFKRLSSKQRYILNEIAERLGCRA